MLRAGTSPAQPLPACTLTVGPGSFLRWGKTSPWPGGGRREAPTIGGCSSIPGVRACAVGLAARLCLGLGGAVGLLRRRGAKAPLQPWPHPGSLLWCPAVGNCPQLRLQPRAVSSFLSGEALTKCPPLQRGHRTAPVLPGDPASAGSNGRARTHSRGAGRGRQGGKKEGSSSHHQHPADPLPALVRSWAAAPGHGDLGMDRATPRATSVPPLQGCPHLAQ